MPKVTVVLPTYNGEKYIKESIDSIINQDFLDWELIIVDDCSNDLTPEIAEKYAQKDNRIKVVHNSTNKKLPASLNIGFSMAKGEYYTWTSDDNIYLPNAISNMVDVLDNNKEIAMVCADMEIIDLNSNIIGGRKPYEDNLIFAENNVGACFLYRGYVRDEVGDYDTEMFLVEDYDYWIRIRNKYGSIYRIDKILYRYREHGDSLSSTKTSLVYKQLCRLKRGYIDDIFSTLEGKYEYLAKVYYDFKLAGENNPEIIDRFYKVMPVLKNEVECLEDKTDKKIILFGAGEIGKKTNSLLAGKVEYFADNNSSKIGTVFLGKKVLSPRELSDIYFADDDVSLDKKSDIRGEVKVANQNFYKYQIIISTKVLDIYSIMKQLSKMGIYNFCSYILYKQTYKVGEFDDKN